MSCDLFKRRAGKCCKPIKHVLVNNVLALCFCCLSSYMNSDELDFAFIVRRKQYQIRGFWQLQDGELFVSILSAAVAADVWHDFICDRGRHHAQTHKQACADTWRRRVSHSSDFSASNSPAPSYASAARIYHPSDLFTYRECYGKHGRRNNAQIFVSSANVLVTESSSSVFKI